MSGQSKTLEYAFRLAEEAYGIRVCYWALGLPWKTAASLSLDQEVHVSHGCAYCKLVKEGAANTDRCMRSKAFGIHKAIHDSGLGFDGLCHMGVHDIVMPVRWEGRITGVLYLSSFRLSSEQERAERLIRRGCKRMHLPKEIMLDAYRSLPSVPEEKLQSLYTCANYLREMIREAFREGHKYDPDGLSREESKNKWLTENILPYLEANFRSDLSLTRLAEIFYVNTQYLCRAFRLKTGMSFKKYVAQLRIEEAKHQLADTEDSVSDISRQVGFSDANYFSRVFRLQTGLSPVEYRQGSKQ